MNRYLRRLSIALMALFTLAGCATRPINPPIAHADPNTGYRYSTREFHDKDTLVVLAFSVITANRSFYEDFLVDPEETEGRYIYELGAGQWNIPELIKQLQEVLSEKKSVSDFEVATEFPNIGRKTMMFNAREIRKEVYYSTPSLSLEKENAGLILLAIEDITERKKIEDAQMFLVQSGWVARARTSSNRWRGIWQ